jgi:hypothetical protein
LDEKENRSRYTIGGKVYEYLRLKKPILAMVPEDGEAARLISATRSGVVVPASNTTAISETLLEWMARPPSFDFVHIERFSRKALATDYRRHLERIVENHNLNKR